MQHYEIRFWLPCPRSEIYAYVSNVRNLNRMTPDWLRFELLPRQRVDLSEGKTVDYRMRYRWLPLWWRSRVTVWRPERVFTYEQQRGPFRRWVHEHRFRQRDGGTLVIDRVDYALYAEPLLERKVADDVRAIFEHRVGVLRREFGEGVSRTPR